jgi:hypothetical protein
MTQLRAILTFMALISLSACQPDYGLGSDYALANLNYESGSEYGLSSRIHVNTNPWVVRCWSREVSTTGEVRGRDHCTLDKGGAV